MGRANWLSFARTISGERAWTPGKIHAHIEGMRWHEEGASLYAKIFESKDFALPSGSLPWLFFRVSKGPILCWYKSVSDIRFGHFFFEKIDFVRFGHSETKAGMVRLLRWSGI
jgi:hypothetical protein